MKMAEGGEKELGQNPHQEQIVKKEERK